jgi:hypothetical protein
VHDAQEEYTVTLEGSPTVNYHIDFRASSTGAYIVPLTVYEDADTYYYFAQNEAEDRTPVTLYIKSHTGAEYNTTAEYTGGTKVENIRLSASGSGAIVQAGLEAVINGGALSIQKFDMYVKQGRIF